MDRFVQFLDQEATRQRNDGVNEPIAILDYVKCAEGSRAGQAFWSLMWGRGGEERQDWCLFTVSNVTIYMSRQTQQALKWKHIDYVDNQVVVPT